MLMAGLVWRRVVTTMVVVGGFGLYLASIAFQWNPPLWLIYGGVVLGIAMVALLSLPRRRVRGSAELYASDAYSDAYLGRGRPEHPYRDPQPASQIGAALPEDPLSAAIAERGKRPSEI